MKLGSGVTIIEVSQALGYYANPIMLSRLVKHPNVNKWSRVKPIPYTGPSYDNVSELEGFMDGAAWGFEMDSVQPMNTDAQTYGSAVTLSMGECWHYSGLTPTEEYPARLGDFRHYNTDAENPYLPVELYYLDPGVEGHKPTKIRLKWGMNQSANVEINPYNDTNLRGNYHILLKKSGTTTGASMIESAVTENFTGMTSPLIEVGTAQTGTYQVCAAIVRGGGNHEVYPLPETYVAFELKNQTEEEYTGLRLENQCSMTRSSATGELTVRLKITNISNEQITAVVNALVYDSQATPHRLWPVNANNYTGETVTIAPGASLTFYGADNYLTTTPQEPIRIEDIGSTVRPPVAADCTTYNTLKQDVHITKTATILNS